MQNPSSRRAPIALLAPALALAGCSSGSGTLPDPGLAFLDIEARADTTPAGSSDSTRPEITASGMNVAVVWEDDRSGVDLLYANVSLDGGRTWRPSDVPIPASGPSVPDIDLDPGGVARSGNDIYVAFEEPIGGLDDVHMNISRDGGRTWLPTALRLDTDAAHVSDSDEPQVAVDGSRVYVAWEEARASSMDDVHFNMSDDGGVTWLPSDVRLSTNTPGSSFSDDVRVVAASGHVYVLWNDTRDGLQETYFNRSVDGGVSWLASDQAIGTDVAGAASSFDAEAVTDGSGIYVAWVDERAPQSERVYFNRSLDAGATWMPADVRVDSAPVGTDAREVRLKREGSRLHLVWSDDREQNEESIFYNVSDDLGLTWEPTDRRLPTSPLGLSEAEQPVLDVTGNSVVVAWIDDRKGDWNLFMRYSRDGGGTWIPSDLRVDVGNQAGSGECDLPTLTCNPAGAWAAWEDDRNGDHDVYVNGGALPTAP